MFFFYEIDVKKKSTEKQTGKGIAKLNICNHDLQQ